MTKTFYSVTESHSPHIPSLSTSEGVLDMFSICILTELSNVLSLQTYSEQGMSVSDREHCVQARQRSRDLLDWFFSTYELIRPGVGSPVVIDGKKEVYWPYMVRVVKGLIRYKELSADTIPDSIEGCTAQAVKWEVEACFRDNAEYRAACSFWGEDHIESLAWPTDDQHMFMVRPLTTPGTRKSKPLHYVSLFMLKYPYLFR